MLNLDGTNFDKALEKWPRIFLYVYMTGCKHCVEFAPKYAKAAAILKESGIVVAKLEG